MYFQWQEHYSQTTGVHFPASDLSTGYFLVYPSASDVHFLNSSDEKMKSYLFAKKNKPHRFCPECSSSVLIDLSEADDIPESMKGKLAVNHQAALFKGIDLEKAEIYKLDGRNMVL
ncbi:hypothetical protein LTS10_000712 [Elasticomyces elasticus]|nr:hypothetical protein LTS10_000712 [Elasticomyces elasticus]